MKKYLFLFLIILNSLNSNSQPKFIAEGGYSLNLLKSNSEVNQTKSASYCGSIGITGRYVPIYLMASFSQIEINDKLFKTNKYSGNLAGLKIGYRLFATKGMSRFQPIIESGFQMSIESKETKPLLYYANGALGFEFFLSPRISLAFLGSYDVLGFEENINITNYSAKSFLRIVL